MCWTPSPACPPCSPGPPGSGETGIRFDSVTAAGADARAPARLVDGVEVFEPDRDDIAENLTAYVEDRKAATGGRPGRGKAVPGQLTGENGRSTGSGTAGPD
ncbi:hypothetical protein [Streptomyces cinerochromogenes]|uniref:hypothetical protein n=1 Tax=Streptomyces cinerochromogenes TaxID=66422 RepID=UPI001670CC63|nr:hypothetical protein [Streptomyces cinerochromogenes]GGS47050.1 hypothetical protein GCM10010206_06020 [Streptomyces cinerochromogenes]